MRKEMGFTLVEIAVVLVIIGLLLGGVLKGQELITQAKIRNVAKDFDGLTAAIYSYRDRYRALPGDDAGAVTRWSLTTEGNGDGVIGGKYNSTTDTDESRMFWLELRKSGFIGGDTDSPDQPLNAANGKLGVQNGAVGLVGPVVCSANLPAKIAIGVDTQLDDGKGDTGDVRAFKQTGTPNPDVGASASPSPYVETGSDLYVVCRVI